MPRCQAYPSHWLASCAFSRYTASMRATPSNILNLKGEQKTKNKEKGRQSRKLRIGPASLLPPLCLPSASAMPLIFHQVMCWFVGRKRILERRRTEKQPKNDIIPIKKGQKTRQNSSKEAKWQWKADEKTPHQEYSSQRTLPPLKRTKRTRRQHLPKNMTAPIKKTWPHPPKICMRTPKYE